jgi:RNA-directed DNA polymerase
MEVGASHISDEASNDRGAKGWHKSDNAKGRPMAVHSIDEQQRTTKLERIGKLAEERKEQVFNNLGHAIDLNLLRECYQRLDGKKAVGIDKVSKAEYGEKLEENLKILLSRIRKKAYKPRPSRIVEIPKEDGSTRPLAISCFEDKIVQLAVATLLTTVYEPLFLPSSFGYREGTNGHEALRALMKHSNRNPRGATLEIDLKRYFNTIPHGELLKLLQKKIADKRFLTLVATLLRAPVLEGCTVKQNTLGCPQGSIAAPILSNIYLHYVLDEWFETIKSSHIKGRAELIRFADDAVFVFQHPQEAQRAYKTLPKRLGKYGLELHEGKSKVMLSGGVHAQAKSGKQEQLPTYKFLGFVCYWGKSRAGLWRLKYKSRSDRLTRTLKELRQYLKENSSQETKLVLKRVNRIVKGWTNYHAISDNQRMVSCFILLCKHILFNWLNRRGGKRKINWSKFTMLLKRIGYPERFKTVSMFTTC